MTDNKEKTKTSKEELEMDKGDIFKMFDEADEEQVEAQLKGAVAEEMVYSFKAGGQEVEGLSAAGTFAAMDAYNETALKDNKPIIRVSNLNDKLIFQDGFVIYKVFAELVNPQSGEVLRRNPGSANQPVNVSTRSGSGFPDPFFAPKATTKATRNAVRGLLPDSLIKKLIKQYSKKQKVRQFLSGSWGSQQGEMKCEDCNKPLTRKAIEFYTKYPDRPKRCYLCNEKRKKEKQQTS